MGDGEVKTLADAIRIYTDCQRTGERLMARVVENDRKMAEHYRMIRDALSGPGMGRVGVLDETRNSVYMLDGNGCVASLSLKASEDVLVDRDGGEGVPL